MRLSFPTQRGSREKWQMERRMEQTTTKEKKWREREEEHYLLRAERSTAESILSQMFDLSAASMTKCLSWDHMVSVCFTPTEKCPLILDGCLTYPDVWPHLVCGDCELFGAVHHVRGSVFGPTQALAALVQSLAGLLYGAGHAVGSWVQYAVTCRRKVNGQGY